MAIIEGKTAVIAQVADSHGRVACVVPTRKGTKVVRYGISAPEAEEHNTADADGAMTGAAPADLAVPVQIKRSVSEDAEVSAGVEIDFDNAGKARFAAYDCRARGILGVRGAKDVAAAAFPVGSGSIFS